MKSNRKGHPLKDRPSKKDGGPQYDITYLRGRQAIKNTSPSQKSSFFVRVLTII